MNYIKKAKGKWNKKADVYNCWCNLSEIEKQELLKNELGNITITEYIEKLEKEMG